MESPKHKTIVMWQPPIVGRGGYM